MKTYSRHWRFSIWIEHFIFYSKYGLHNECEDGHLPIVEYLISKGVNINVKDERGDYAIHYASRNGYLTIVQYLIEKQNIDIDIKGKM